LPHTTAQNKVNNGICLPPVKEISQALPAAESKVWHRAPVWFLDGNPMAG